MQEESAKRVIRTEIPVNAIPNQGAWIALLKDGREVLEGAGVWWDDLGALGVHRLSVMGITMPVSIGYEFSREAVATTGASGEPIKITVRAHIDDSLALEYIFFKVGKVASDKEMKKPNLKIVS